MKRKDCVAMILAGGQGSRLGSLTKTIAKPVVPFGGKYKIIDFAMSNCINSGIDTVGVLTQYQPHELSRYIGSGQPWDMDRYNGGIYILPPYMKGKSGEWYKGTANAIYQNLAFIESFDPEDVLILSGDHIYIMDYRKMLDEHEAKGAAATIAVITVPWEEASRFGIMSVDEDWRVVNFAEKPKKPASNLASMGVYVFNWKMLKKYLILDEQTEKSSNDFGKNIIPMMLKDKVKLIAHSFHSYWKDVGTLESLWQANMDLLAKPLPLDMYDDKRRIYCRNPAKPPHYVAPGAQISDSLVTEGCDIFGKVEKSVVFTGVTVGKGSRITNSVIFPNATIGSGCAIDSAIVGDNAVIGDGCRINVSDDDWEAAGGAKVGYGSGAGADASLGAGFGLGAGLGAGVAAGSPAAAAGVGAEPGAGLGASGRLGAEAPETAGMGSGEPGGAQAALIGADSLSGAEIYEDTLISEYCTGGITLIAPDVSIGDGIRIGRHCMVERSMVAKGARAAGGAREKGAAE